MRTANVARQRLEDRFWSKVDKDGPTILPELGPCWVWTSAKDKRGYGRFNLGGNKLAHRIMWKLTGHKDYPKQLCHKCDNTSCVNPDHFHPGDAYWNLHDSFSKGRLETYFNTKKTQCKRGHEFDYFPADGSRQCSVCRYNRTKESRIRRGLAVDDGKRKAAKA